jgi:hypothetical protein
MHTFRGIFASVRPLLLGVLLWTALFGGASSFTGTLFAVVGSDLPVIETQPKSQTVGVGAEVILSVTAVSTGTASLTYQWRKGGVSIAGGTAFTYSIAVSNSYANNFSSTCCLYISNTRGKQLANTN